MEPIVLVGMMGAGKTTIGKALAARHGLSFVDADEALEARTGVPIPLIFELEGEAGFRDREARLLDELLAKEDLVIATAHPSPLSARRGFFGSKPFSRINTWLEQQGRQPVDWAAR